MYLSFSPRLPIMLNLWTAYSSSSLDTTEHWVFQIAELLSPTAQHPISLLDLRLVQDVSHFFYVISGRLEVLV